MTLFSLKLCIVGIAILSVSVDAGDSMVCGKPSMRDALTEEHDASMWKDLHTTATTAVNNMAADLARKEQELKDLEAQLKAKQGETSVDEMEAGEVETLIGSAFGGDDNFADAADAAKYDCGYGMEVPYDQMDFYMMAFDAALAKFKTKVEPALKDAGKMVKKSVFSAKCLELLPGDSCVGLCDEFGFAASDANAKGGKSLGHPTESELTVMVSEKREERKQAENVHKECVESLATVARLSEQFTKNTAVVTRSTRMVGGVTRRLKMTENIYRAVMVNFTKAVEEDKKARAALAAAVAAQEEARINKEEAAETLRMWEEHMAALLKAIEAQKIVVRQTEEALRAAEAASRVVVEFKGKLTTALTGLVRYYDEAIREPLRVMGIKEEVAIESLFPVPSETEAGKSLKAGLDKTQEYCTERKASLQAAAVADIEASGAKLTAICDAQDWTKVAGEVDTAVTARKQRAIKNLEQAQQKVVSYSGVTASKADGEVEGVWKAVAIYGDTKFAKEYLSGWKFDGTSEAKGSNAGFMMELAKALDAARERAAKLWEEAKEELAVLEEEKKQVEEILVIARKHLQDMIVEFDKAVKITEEKRQLAKEAKEALDIVTARKEQLEDQIGKLTSQKQGLEDAVKNANKVLQETHDEALGAFMELLHASEQQASESWD